MPDLTRRELLRLLASAVPSLTLLAQVKEDIFQQERICLHIYDPKQSIPDPLKERQPSPGRRSPSRKYFHAGISELILCTSSERLLNIFQYFWPVSGPEFRQLQESISVQFEKPTVSDSGAIDQLKKYLGEQRSSLQREAANVAVVFTYNDYTRFFTPILVDLCKTGEVHELLIIKDPTKAPYLCDHPSIQKGFRKPPPG
ncbi:MAG: hypothetical protein FJ217_02885 [Ignavibacteria bacterium]|nr:hypothetical protein [Ignavibacteria bacterium]